MSFDSKKHSSTSTSSLAFALLICLCMSFCFFHTTNGLPVDERTLESAGMHMNSIDPADSARGGDELASSDSDLDAQTDKEQWKIERLNKLLDDLSLVLEKQKASNEPMLRSGRTYPTNEMRFHQQPALSQRLILQPQQQQKHADNHLANGDALMAASQFGVAGKNIPKLRKSSLIGFEWQPSRPPMGAAQVDRRSAAQLGAKLGAPRGSDEVLISQHLPVNMPLEFGGVKRVEAYSNNWNNLRSMWGKRSLNNREAD